jgi:peptidoglycan/xylan/chitin deacetylase (PgdA/CDA1 family)
LRVAASAVVGVLGGGALWSWPAPLPLLPGLAARLGVPCRLASARGIGLTFDDGPHPQGTPATLRLLADARATATFYLVGEQVQRWPSLAAEIAAAGHEIGLHGYRHRLLLRRCLPELADDLERASTLIAAATGREPLSYRPPYGVFSSGALRLVRRRGWQPMLWSRWGRDWGAHETPAAIARRATRALGPGDVVLLHDADHYSAPDSWRRMVAALPMVLESATGLGVPFVTVTEST